MATARRSVRRAAALVLAALVYLAAEPASGGTLDRATRRGECDGVSSWALTVRSVDAEHLRVRLVIAGGRAGDEWNVFMDHNRVGFLAESRVAREGGLVVVRASVDDLPGSDLIRAGAHDTVTGETCRARVVR